MPDPRIGEHYIAMGGSAAGRTARIVVKCAVAFLIVWLGLGGSRYVWNHWINPEGWPNTPNGIVHALAGFGERLTAWGARN